MLLLAAILLSACASTSVHVGSQSIALSRQARWGILPFANNTQTPQAGAKVSAMLTSVLRAKGVRNIITYKQVACDKLMGCSTDQITTKQIMVWGKRNHVSYAMQGTVNEWRYKVGLDGEPSVNVTLALLDTKNGHVVWSAVGSKTGGSRSGLSDIGQNLIVKLTSKLSLS